MTPATDQEFVEYVVRAIVDLPDKVKVERKVDEMGVLIELTVDPTDMGKIIGKEGRTAKSIRTLLRVLGAKNNARVNLKIIEPEGGRGPAMASETPSDDRFADKPAETPVVAPLETPEEAPAEAPAETPSSDVQPIEEEKTTPLE
ncbi:MAG TPA: KH domain-containing protein [Patescibacteria group bacterium]|nr:KH domain-containing protein [Patescibacteria group bacterium]